MGAILQSLGRTITAGVVVLIIIMAIAGTFGQAGTHAWWAFFMRYLHVLSGVMWIGLLWYFNFVQTPSMPKIPTHVCSSAVSNLLYFTIPVINITEGTIFSCTY